MSITGGIKFFKLNKALKKDSTTITASSNDSLAKLMIDNSKYTRWVSSGSDDTTTETIEITLPRSETLDRILILVHNLKDFNIKYHDGSSYVHFANVVGLDGSMTNITETAMTRASAYYEFDSVATDRIQIEATKTHTVDAEKTIETFIATQELGTFEGYPIVRALKHDRNTRVDKTLSNKVLVQKTNETTGVQIQFKNYPLANDISLCETLHDREESFLVWLCGGREGTDYFKITQRGWRIKDVLNMQVIRPLGAEYEKNVYVNGVKTSLTLLEAI